MDTPVCLGSISHDSELFLVYWDPSWEFINHWNHSFSESFLNGFAQANMIEFQFLSPIRKRLYSLK